MIELPPPGGPIRTELLAATPAAITRAAELLLGEQPVAFPTETVYGLGARCDCARAVRRVYEAKGRPPTRALILHLRSAADAPRFVQHWSEEADRLATHFWPGPLTLVLERSAAVIDEVAGGGSTVAMRVPAHPVALALLDACGFALAAPSANRSGQPAPRSAQEVLEALGGRIPLVLDAGTLGALEGAMSGREHLGSTIVDLTRRPAVVLRVGALPVAMIAEHVTLHPLEPRGAPGES